MSSINPDAALRGVQGPWVFGCNYCRWSSLDIGWQFEKNTGLHNAVQKLNTEAIAKQSKSSTSEDASLTNGSRADIAELPSRFTSLRRFYNAQLSDSAPASSLLPSSGGFDYSSPSSIARILSIYTGKGTKKDNDKSGYMREALTSSEGLQLHRQEAEEAAIASLKVEGWRSTTSAEQRSRQPHSPPFVNQLRPTQPLLRTKRGKRCRTCRHILVKPEPKVLSTRFKIKLIAANYIPTISLKPLQPAPSSQQPPIDLGALPPYRACQFLLTFKNPLFDPIKLTLATPSQTPGRWQHKVTILCPDFSIGSSVDQWNEALGSSQEKRLSRHLNPTKTEYAGEAGKVAEAGKVWDKGRNWTTTVLEVSCTEVKADVGEEQDEEALEIPIFIRIEWETETQDGQGKQDAKRERRELAYWTVLGVGRVGKVSA